MHDKARFILEDNPCLIDDTSNAEHENEARRLLLNPESTIVSPVQIGDIQRHLEGDCPTPLGIHTLIKRDHQITGFFMGWECPDVNPDSIQSVEINMGFIPAPDYPVLNMYLRVCDGSDEDFLIDYNFPIHTSRSRIRLYQMVVSDAILLLLFKGDTLRIMPLQIVEFTRVTWLAEIQALFNALPDYKNLDMPKFDRALDMVCDAIQPGCFPVDKNSAIFEYYEVRKKYKPNPRRVFWDGLGEEETYIIYE